MAGQDITFDDVAASAAGLQAQGRSVTVDAVRSALGGASASAVGRHLAAWRAEHAQPPEAAPAELPPALLAGLADWARQYAQDSAAPSRAALEQMDTDMQALVEAGEELEAERDDLQAQVAIATSERDDALATIAERGETIDRLNAELNNARQVAMDALVGKAKDQLAIEGKDSQIADLRAQLERSVATQGTLSDARLAAEMELVGATTARDSLAAELKGLRAQVEAARKGK